MRKGWLLSLAAWPRQPNAHAQRDRRVWYLRHPLRRFGLAVGRGCGGVTLDSDWFSGNVFPAVVGEGEHLLERALALEEARQPRQFALAHTSDRGR